jgi:hypothetical protein
MAGGPYAAVVMCMLCTGKAIRIYEGYEDDTYQCEACGETFGIDWSRGQPDAPCWPPSPEELELARQM